MKKASLFAALLLGLALLLAGCGGGNVNRELRNLPETVRYEYDVRDYTVTYKDSKKQQISIYGKLYVPKGEENEKFPAVVLSHGFNGHYSDFPTECDKFAKRGYCCYAFDFCGAQAGGLSEGRTAEEYTPFTMKEDLLAVFNSIKKLIYVDKTQVFLFGGSQGGFVTALTAADKSICNEVAAVALYFPAFNIPDDWNNKPIENTPLMGYSIGAAFISSVQNFDPYSVIGNYKKDVCIVWGDKDVLVARKYIDRAVETYGAEKASLTVLEGAGHGFGGDALVKASDTVLAFLEAHTFVTK